MKKIINKIAIKAFSMVELSIVIMVIGVAIAAIVKSSSLFYAFKSRLLSV